LTLAEEINNHLHNGGVVQVTTYLKSWLYRSRHTGWFFMQGDNLHVKHGRGNFQLSNGDNVLVKIQFGKEVKA
jgi:hypothetical protein